MANPLTWDDLDAGNALSSAIWGYPAVGVGVYEMAPASPLGRFHDCSRCPVPIEPDEPYHRSTDGAVAWCDACMMEEEADL